MVKARTSALKLCTAAEWCKVSCGGAGAKSVSQGLALLYFTAHGPLWRYLLAISTDLLVASFASLCLQPLSLYLNFLILLQKKGIGYRINCISAAKRWFILRLYRGGVSHFSVQCRGLGGTNPMATWVKNYPIQERLLQMRLQPPGEIMWQCRKGVCCTQGWGIQ